VNKLKAPGAAFALFLVVVAGFEGLRRTAYLDIAGVPTVCYGHTGPEVRVGMKLSQAECEELLAKDAEWAWHAVDKHVRGEMTPAQWVALASWTFNFGEGALKSSTMLRLANEGDWLGACNELPKWNKALNPKTGRKEVVRGLVLRRAAERLLCLGYAFDHEFSPNHRPLMSR
jgi:lysozyme